VVTFDLGGEFTDTERVCTIQVINILTYMLYVVATPLGNLKDITLRVLETLRSADIIIAENPGYTKKLLTHFEIAGKKIVQFAEHNELKVLPSLVKELRVKVGCLVTDAGTPSISDPGFRLVRGCVEAEIKIEPLPGPSASISALVASGLPTDRFIFLGFLPKTEPKLVNLIEKSKNLEATIIFYESPHRILKTLSILANHFPSAQTVVARELTKLHEEFIRGTSKKVSEVLLQRPSIKGEITVLLSFKKLL